MPFDPPSPELIWGLLSRGVALIFLISFASLSFQVMPAAGSNGITPVGMRLDLMKRDFPTWRRFVYFPTLLWISHSDRALRALPILGILAASSAVFGGPHVPYAFFACWILYLSLDRAMILIYPWDCMLFEAGFFAMFLPATLMLPEIAATTPPEPILAWAYRLLGFRVIFGFGKFKFLGTTRHDTGYLKGFFINQPLPSPVGWLSHHLPMWMLKGALVVMFITEVPAPFAVFFPGPASIIAGVSIAGLMMAIWLSGTFGYFNWVMAIVLLSWCDTETAQAFTFASLISPEGPIALRVLIVVHTIGAVISFPFNSFCANSWLLWSLWERIRPRFLAWPVKFYRALHPLRWLHSYGVFPPASVPGVKMVPVMEVSWDGQEWQHLRHEFSPTSETSPPKFCAPHHARLDQALIYEAFGLSDASVLRNLVGVWEPYGHGRCTGAALLARRVLEGNVPGTVFFDESLERERGAPQIARVRTYMLEPTTPAEVRATGHWWKKTLVGPHTPPMELDDGFWDHLIPPPELWHFDDRVWLRRSHFGALMDRAEAGQDPHELALVGAEDITAEDTTKFWEDFVPAMQTARSDYTNLPELIAELRARYSHTELYRMERLAGRYGALMSARLEPLFVERGIRPALGGPPPTVDVKTNYHLGLLCQHIVGEGRAAYDAVMADPPSAAAHVPAMTMHSGNAFHVVFRYDVFVFQAQKARLLERYIEHENKPGATPEQKRILDRIDAIVRRLWGAVEVVEFLKTEFTGAQHQRDVPENSPRFTWTESGEIRRIEHD